MAEYIIDRAGIRQLRSLCGLTDLRLLTTSMSMTWGRNAIVPSISISNENKFWIIIRGELGYSPRLKVEYDYEFSFISVSKEKAPESVQYISREHGSQMMDRNLSSIDFEQPSNLEKISIINFIDEIDEGESISYDGALVFSFVDGRQFSLSAHTSPGGLLELSTDMKRIIWLENEGEIREIVAK